MRLDSSRVVGVPSELYWSDVFERRENSQSLSFVFTVRDKPVSVKASILRELQVSSLQNLEHLHSIFQRILAQFPEIVSLSAIWVDTESKKICAWSFGEGSCVCLRERVIKRVVQSDVLTVRQGTMLENDIFFAMTSLGMIAFPFDAIQYEQGSVDALAEYASPILLSHAQNAEIAIAILSTKANIQTEQKTETSQFVIQNAHRFTILSFIKVLREKIQNLKRKRFSRLFFIVLGIGLMVGGIWGMSEVRQRKIQRSLDPMRLEYAQIRNLGEDQRFEARKSAVELRTKLISLAETFKKQSLEYKTVMQFSREVDAFALELSKSTKIENPDVFYQFALIQQNFIATSVDISAENEAVFFDQSSMTAIQINLDTKKSQTIKICDSLPIQDVAIHDSHVFALGNGVCVDGKAIESSASAWKAPTLLDSFGSAVYVFDREAKQIWKIADILGVSAVTEWMSKAPAFDFSTVRSLAIDGEIWLGTDQGQIFRLVRGGGSQFKPTELEEAFTSTVFVAVREQVPHLAVVEPQQQRVVVFEKSGKFLRSFSSEAFAGVTGVDLSNDGSRVVLSAGSTSYIIQL